MADNKVKFGLKNVHYALLTLGEADAVTFSTPVAIPGAVNLSLDAAGDTSSFYADNMAYFVTAANDGYSGSLEMALIPDSFRKDVLGETEDATDKVLVENSAAEGKHFALLFEFAGDQNSLQLHGNPALYEQCHYHQHQGAHNGLSQSDGNSSPQRQRQGENHGQYHHHCLQQLVHHRMAAY